MAPHPHIHLLAELADQTDVPDDAWVVFNWVDWAEVEREFQDRDGVLEKIEGPHQQELLFGLPVWKTFRVVPENIQIVSEDDLLTWIGAEFQMFGGQRYYQRAG